MDCARALDDGVDPAAALDDALARVEDGLPF